MKELMTLERDEFKLDGSNMTINVHLLFAGGDISACVKLAGQSWHIYPSGCRCCTIKALRTEGKNVFYPSNSIAYRTKASFTMTVVDSGQKLPTPFTGLKRLHGTFFPNRLNTLVWLQCRAINCTINNSRRLFH